MHKNQYAQFLQRCYELADIAKAKGESPVGSVIVKDNKIIGEGYEMSRQLHDITRHAEIVALLDALKKVPDISDAILFTNVEPCILCAYAIRHYKIKEVVFAQFSGELGGTHLPLNVLSCPDITVWNKPPKITVIQ